MTPSLRLVFWETTKACNLTCQHCRAVPQRRLGPTELTTNRAFDLIDQIAEVAKPVFVLSGGEPLFRPDLFDIAEYGVETGFRMALATNGTLVTERVAAKIADSGISRVAISVDGAVADDARSVSRSAGVACARASGSPQSARGRRVGPDQLDDREAQCHRTSRAARSGARDRCGRLAPVHARAGRLRPRARAFSDAAGG